jgi:hypothetical protein
MKHSQKKTVEFLARPGVLEAGHAKPKIIETHISYVFIGKDFVYKLKKNIKLSFLDFSTLDCRRQACEDEVRLNKRTSEDVYLDVVTVYMDNDKGFTFEGERPIEYLVKMRRLPEELFLNYKIENSLVVSKDVEEICESLFTFFRKRSAHLMDPTDYVESLRNKIFENKTGLDEVCHDSEDQVERIHSLLLLFLARFKDEIENRVRNSKVIEGHGDLRPEHICLESPTKVIDCIEFNKDFRLVDMLDELCFLAVECEFINGEETGARILNQYRGRFEDSYPFKLQDFYKSYRAAVRAKVDGMNFQKEDGDTRYLKDHRRHLNLAEKYAQSCMKPTIFVVGGLMGTGKSTLAQRISKSFFLDVIQTDRVRKELFPDSSSSEFGKENRDMVYRECLGRARGALLKGKSIVVDGTFLKAPKRQAAFELSRELNCDFMLVFCECPEEVALHRLRSRSDPMGSEAHPDLYAKQRQSADTSLGQIPSIKVDTTESVEQSMIMISKRLMEQSQSQRSIERSENLSKNSGESHQFVSPER